MKKFSISKIESCGLVDGPGVRVVVFLNGCKLRCLYCHNPEMWKIQDKNYTSSELIKQILRYKPYIKNNGGVTFSGGEPLLYSKELLEVVKELKKENIHIAIDTAGVGDNYLELLDYIDLVIFDIKSYQEKMYKQITGFDIFKSLTFLKDIQTKNKEIWIRQVIVPGINDNKEYILGLKEFISNIKNVTNIELLPYHTLGVSKYRELNIKYPLEGLKAMDINKCLELEKILK